MAGACISTRPCCATGGSTSPSSCAIRGSQRTPLPVSCGGAPESFTKDRVYRTPPSRSRALRDRVRSVASELHETGTIRDPARRKLVATRKSVVDGWMEIAARLDAQGEVVLAGDVRYFASNLPKVLTDRERLAVQLLRYQALQRAKTIRVWSNGPGRSSGPGEVCTPRSSAIRKERR